MSSAIQPTFIVEKKEVREEDGWRMMESSTTYLYRYVRSGRIFDFVSFRKV